MGVVLRGKGGRGRGFYCRLGVEETAGGRGSGEGKV